MNQKLIDFYRGTGKDDVGRSISEVWQFDHALLESTHAYIQWLFPLATASKFNANAPLLDDETIALWNGDDKLKTRLEKSLRVMLPFYGLDLAPAAGTIVVIKKAANYASRKDNWQDADAGFINHNLLRLTRILESLRVLGLTRESLALYRCLEAIQKEDSAKIPAKTLSFWKRAAGLS